MNENKSVILFCFSFPFQNVTLPMAHIKVSDEHHHSVVTEGIEICKAGELTEAVCLLVAVHYILDLQYHPKVYNTLPFFQKVILNIQDGEKKKFHY